MMFFVFSCIILLVLAIYCFRRRKEAGAVYFGAVLLSQALSVLGSLFEFLSPHTGMKLFFDQFQYVGAAGWMVFMWFFATAISGYGRPRTWKTVAFVLLPAAAMALFTATDPLHGLARIDPQIVTWGGLSILAYEFSPVTIGFAMYAYSVILFALSLLTRKYLRMHRLYRGQMGFIILGNALPVLGMILTLTVFREFPLRDFSPFTFTVGNLLAAWGLIHYGLFAIIPLARDLLIDVMDDAVLVLDREFKVIDFNEAASEVCLAGGDITIGSSFARMCTSLDNAIQVNDLTMNETRDVVLNTPRGVRYFELKTWALASAQDTPHGYLLMFRDISDRKKIELELRKSRDALISRLDRAQALQEKLEEMAVRDALTGLYNRYVLEDIFARELQRAERSTETVGCILLDIDFFKVVNDEYGHQTGDLIVSYGE